MVGAGGQAQVFLDVANDPVLGDAIDLVGQRLEQCPAPQLACLQREQVLVAFDLEADGRRDLLEQLGLLAQGLVVDDGAEGAAYIPARSA